MDPITLGTTLVTFLSPFLPHLLKLGEKVAEEAGKQLGADAWEEAKTIWSKLRPKVETRPTVQEAVQDVARNPADEDAQTVLRIQLKKLLTEDAALAKELSATMAGRVVQRALAERGSTIRGLAQSATGEVDVEQDVTARDNSIIERVEQRQG